MSQNTNGDEENGTAIRVSVPSGADDLYASSATEEVLLFLSRHRFERFSQRELAEQTDVSDATIRRTVRTLDTADLVVVRAEDGAKHVEINRDRLDVPDDPFLQIPQSEFRAPVREAAVRLTNELPDVLGIVLYGSVARGEADRRSDIDLWILVRTDRPVRQRTAAAVERELEETRFDGERYDFHIAVESAESVSAFSDEISRIVLSGITIRESEEFRTLRNALAHGEFDE